MLIENNTEALAKQTFGYVDYVLCRTFEIDEELEKAKDNFYNYDYIFITDLCPSNEKLLSIEKSGIKEKFKIFDYHKGTADNIDRDYDFLTLKLKNDKGKCCGTSLFYEYLINNNYLKPSKTLDKMVELTRLYDTWEWKEVNNLEACDLTYLLNACGIEEYISRVLKKANESVFSFNGDDYKKINDWKREFNLKIKSIVDKMICLEISKWNAGIVKTDYEYRNDIAEYNKDNKYDINFLVLIYPDKSSVSYRSINENCDVNEIAQMYGGYGHRAAASSPITEEEKIEILEYFNKIKV
jgi:oligoribonuclease NrnB/cAMP/cGMP phosphodiesterase (DHH superfamily)